MKLTRIPFITCACFGSLLLLICLFFSGCQQPSEKVTNPGDVLTVQIVHGPELRSFLSSAREQFSILRPRLDNGFPIKIELISEMGFSAAYRIARGELKSEAWVAPSTSLINYANETRINLGSEQTNCTKLFQSPMVLASRKQHLPLLQATNGVFSWESLFGRRADKDKVEVGGIGISFSQAQPRASTTGLASLIQLAYLARVDTTQPLSVEMLQEPAVRERLKAFQNNIFSYPLSESFLLSKTSNISSGKPRFALTTEQQVLQFNQQITDSELKLVPLYPEEGSYWEDYQLCVSAADWVTPGHRAVLDLFSKFLTSPELQSDAKKLGFRVEPQSSLPESEESPKKEVPPLISLPPVSGSVVANLFQTWPELRRPAALILVMDGSGSMEGDPLSTGKIQYRNLVAQTSSNDLKALISFGSDAKVLSSFSADSAHIIQKLDLIQSVGGSAVYEGIRSALEMAAKPDIASYRKLVFVYTDGDDKNSEISLTSMVSLAHRIANEQDISLFIIALDREGADFSDLERIAEAADGVFRRSSLYGMESVFQEVGRSF